MKTKAICSLFVLSALVVGMVATPPIAFADHAEVTITPVPGSEEGCDETQEGCFTPQTATVDVGGKVIFSNTEDAEQHLFISGITSAATDEFDSGVIAPGSSFEWTPTEAGEVSYFCGIHPWEAGTIIVQDASTSMDDKDYPDDKMMMEGDPSVTGMLSDGTMVKIWADAPTEGEMMEITIKFANYGMDDAMMEKDDSMMEDDAMMEKDDSMMEDDAMMEKDDSMMEDDAMMEKDDSMMEDDAMMEKDDSMMEDDAMMEKDDSMMEDDAMMEKDDSMMEDDAMMEKDDSMMEDHARMDGKTGVEHVNYDIVVTQNGENVLNDEGAHEHKGIGVHTTALLSSSDPVDITVTFQGYGVEDLTGPIGEVVPFTNVIPEFGTIAMMVLAVAIISVVAVTAKSRVVPRL